MQVALATVERCFKATDASSDMFARVEAAAEEVYRHVL